MAVILMMTMSHVHDSDVNNDDDIKRNNSWDHDSDIDDLSLLLMMYFSAAVNSPASLGSMVTRSSI